MTACLVEATGLPADDPILLAVLANPPVTPPAADPDAAAAPLVVAGAEARPLGRSAAEHDPDGPADEAGEDRSGLAPKRLTTTSDSTLR